MPNVRCARLSRAPSTMASLTSYASSRWPRCLCLRHRYCYVLAGCMGSPTFIHQPSRRAVLSDPGDASLASLLCAPASYCLRLIETSRPSRVVVFRGSITSSLRPTARLSPCLRLTHFVTSTGPRLGSGCGGHRFPVGTFTPIW